MIGTDDTGVNALDGKLPFARTGRIWPYCGDRDHPVILYDYTATRERAGPEKFLAVIAVMGPALLLIARSGQAYRSVAREIGRLELLNRLSQTITIRPEVYDEVVVRGSGLAGSARNRCVQMDRS